MAEEAKAAETKAESKPVPELLKPVLTSAFMANHATPNLNRALAEAVIATPWVEWTKPEKGGGISYEYLSEEDMVKTLRKILPQHGLTIVPVRMELVNKELYNSSNGGRMVNLLLCVTYRLSHVSGEYIEGQAIGEGSDRGDKAANKAMTAAFKYFLREVTLIAGGIDPDKTSSDELARAEKGKKNQPATQPGKSSGSSQGGQGGQKKPEEKTPDQRLQDAFAHIAKLNSHEEIKKAAKQVGTAFKGDQKRADKAYNACANRATILFVAAIGKAEDLEAVEKIVKQAEADKIGTDNMKKVKDAAEKRSASIVGSEPPDENDAGGSGEDEPEPLDF